MVLLHGFGMIRAQELQGRVVWLTAAVLVHVTRNTVDSQHTTLVKV